MNKLLFLFLFTAGQLLAQNPNIYSGLYPGFTADFENTHSLALPKWGMYGKKYNGISHVANEKSGMRWDLSFHPSYHLRRNAVPASVMHESAYHLWEASADMSYYSCTYELEWKDKVYCDVSFSEVDPDSRYIRAEFVNNTALRQDLALNLFAEINFPPLRSYSNEPLKDLKVLLPENAVWVDAVNYRTIGYAVPPPQASLVYDGHLPGQIRVNNTVNGTAIGSGWKVPDFGVNAGDSLVYTFTLREMKEATVIFRYRLDKGKTTMLRWEGLMKTSIKLTGTGDFDTVHISAGTVKAGKHTVKILTEGGSPIDIDGFAVVEKSKAGEVQFIPTEREYRPEIVELTENYIILKYADLDDYYGIRWDYPSFVHRTWAMNAINEVLRNDMNKFNQEFYSKQELKGDGEGFFNNLFSNMIIVDSGSSKVLQFVVTAGKLDDVKNTLQKDPNRFEEKYKDRKAKAVTQLYNSAGREYAFSQRLMAAVTLTNVVYPVFTQNTYIKHNTPGRVWDCLYTWDSGFIGLGFTKLNKGRAFECLNAYTTHPTDSSAFMHHGTPLPVQAYLFLELWNETQNKEMLKYLYPRMKRYYEFMAGNTPGSTMRTLKSNLLSSWDYFYNSGGWDDYSAQVKTHNDTLESRVAPMVTTAHVIRMARILAMAASELKLPRDVLHYKADIQKFTLAIQTTAWDEASGYFGYVLHTKTGKAEGILTGEGGVNYNMGLDGCSPLIAGVTTPRQTEAVIKNLFTPGKIWSPQGLSTVDQSASYYAENGYWNGSVWMPHQWFFWKTMFDLGRHDEALLIAKTGLEVWKRETEATYNCHEVFPIKSGRSGGWHQFGGLSTPVILWYSAMYKPGTLTAGYDTWINESETNEDFTFFSSKMTIHAHKGDKKLMWLCMNENYEYNFWWNNKPVKAIEAEKGLWTMEITCTGDITSGTLKCEKK